MGELCAVTAILSVIVPFGGADEPGEAGSRDHSSWKPPAREPILDLEGPQRVGQVT
jgi:hypothetical protein